MVAADWAEETGISVFVIKGRIQRGWTPEAALTTPVSKFLQRGQQLIAINGEMRSLRDWSKENDIPIKTVYYRIDNGWSPEEAVTVPISKPNTRPRK
jgi:hypothetical protein